MEELKLPKALSDWEIEDELGEGSFGTVYRIRRDGEACALKVIPFPKEDSELKIHLRELKSREAVSDYFYGQARTCMAEETLQNTFDGCENIVQIYETILEQKDDRIGWIIFMRMELLSDLNDYWDMKEPDETEIIHMALQLCNALEHCERAGVLHRDIKPENILVSDDGTYKLGDFGLARRREASVGSFSLKGTFDYMSPEIYHGRRYGKQADLYSLGMVLYRVLNRSRGPFIPLDKQIITFRDKEEALEKRMSGNPLPSPADASPEMANLVLRLCAFDEGKRFTCAAETAAALRMVQAGSYQIISLEDKDEIQTEEISAEPSLSEQSGVKKKKGKLIPALAAAGVLLCGMIGSFAFTAINSGSNSLSYDTRTAEEAETPAGENTAGENAEEADILAETLFGTNLKASVDGKGILTISAADPDDSQQSMCDQDHLSVSEMVFPWEEIETASGDYTRFVKEIHFEADCEVPDNVFSGMEKLEKVEITGETAWIGSKAFANCKNLTEVSLPETLTSLGSSAFYSCQKLENIEVPENCEIGDKAFEGTAFYDQVCAENDGCFILNHKLYGYEGEASKLEIPEGVTEIVTSCFQSKSSLTKVVIPESVEKIGTNAFMNCSNLAEIICKSTDCRFVNDPFTQTAWEKAQGDFVIMGSTLLKYCGTDAEVYIPDEVTEIIDTAFLGNSNAAVVYLPENIDTDKITDQVWASCSSIRKVYLADGSIYLER